MIFAVIAAPLNVLGLISLPFSYAIILPGIPKESNVQESFPFKQLHITLLPITSPPVVQQADSFSSISPLASAFDLSLSICYDTPHCCLHVMAAPELLCKL